MASDNPTPQPHKPLTPRLFALYRHDDVNGKSGVGTVAWGIQWPDGRAVTWWAKSKVGVHQMELWANVGEVMRTHGHGFKSRIVWLGTAAAVEQMDTALLRLRSNDYQAALAKAGPESVAHLQAAIQAMAGLPELLDGYETLAAAYAQKCAEAEALHAENDAMQAHLEAIATTPDPAGHPAA